MRRIFSSLYVKLNEVCDKIATCHFRDNISVVDCPKIHAPVYIKSGEYINIGKGFYAGPGLRIEAWDEYQGERFHPRILIGNNVCFNFRCHVGAINRIEIHDNVLIGSNVLITDHQHGEVGSDSLSSPPAERLLISKGPVIIQKNVWIGENVAIMPGVVIGEGAVVGANSVVTRDIPCHSVVAGIPAKVINRTTESL